MLTKPLNDQYPEYYQRYVNLAPEGDIFEILKNNKTEIVKLFSTLSEQQAEYKYADDKWSIKELLGHIIDTERIFLCRALRMARNDKTDIPQYDHDAFVVEAKFNNQSIKQLVKQFETGLEAVILLFQSFNDDDWQRVGTSGGKKFIVKCFPFIIAGHELHHIGILKERYLPNI